MRKNHENANFFTGIEIEKSPAYGMKTLFIVGLKTVDTIQKQIDHCNNFKVEHLYFGANQSFCLPDLHKQEFWYKWTQTIKTFLDRGFWCSLDLNVKDVEALHETGLCEYNTFIPMISVPIPYIRLLNYNATLKIDDKTFAGSNPGIWCHSLHELQILDAFTDWSKYSQDKVLK